MGGSRYSGGNAAALGELSGKCEGPEIRYDKPWSLLLIKQARAALLALAMGSAAASMHFVSQERGYPIGCGREGCRLQNKAELWYQASVCRPYNLEFFHLRSFGSKHTSNSKQASAQLNKPEFGFTVRVWHPPSASWLRCRLLRPAAKHPRVRHHAQPLGTAHILRPCHVGCLLPCTRQQEVKRIGRSEIRNHVTKTRGSGRKGFVPRDPPSLAEPTRIPGRKHPGLAP